MKKGKNKFILGVIGLIICIIFFQAYKAYSNSQRDTNSYVSSISGNVKLNNKFVEENVKNIIQVGDRVSVSSKSVGLIEWGDGSLTRLGENTKITIEKNSISRDYTKINISFDLIAGKTWSTVVSFLGKDSSFTQSFQGMEAGVRGTIFDVDLDADYINVSSHEVTLKDTVTGKVQQVEEGKPVRLSTLSLIDIQEFLKNIQDTAWKNLNESYDAKYFELLKVSLETSFYENSKILFLLDVLSPKYRIIATLNTTQSYQEVEDLLKKVKEKEKDKVYNAILSRYQDLNFIDARDLEFYKRKVFYKRALIELSPDEFEKQQLLQATSFDLQDILQTGTQSGLNETLNVLLEHKDTLSKLNTQFLQSSFDLLPPDVFETFQNDMSQIQSLFHMPEVSSLPISDVKSKAEDSIRNLLDIGKEKVLENFGK